MFFLYPSKVKSEKKKEMTSFVARVLGQRTPLVEISRARNEKRCKGLGDWVAVGARGTC